MHQIGKIFVLAIDLTTLASMRILIFIMWIALGIIYFFVWSMRENCCGTTVESKKSTIPTVQNNGAESKSDNMNASDLETSDSLVNQVSNQLLLGNDCLQFKWTEAAPLKNNCIDQQIDSVLKSLKPGQILELVGLFYDKENRIMAPGDLGLLRASKLKDMLTGSKERIKIRSKNLGDTSGVTAMKTEMILLRPVFQNDQVKELDDKTIIYFKFGSNAGVNDSLVNEYINDLAQKLKSNTDQVVVTGHTDDDATAEHNIKLGLKRAEIIKNLLIARGIKASRIKTRSKGEENPIAPNDTEENRKLNRRVEVVIQPSIQSNQSGK